MPRVPVEPGSAFTAPPAPISRGPHPVIIVVCRQCALVYEEAADVLPMRPPPIETNQGRRTHGCPRCRDWTGQEQIGRSER